MRAELAPAVARRPPPRASSGRPPGSTAIVQVTAGSACRGNWVITGGRYLLSGLDTARTRGLQFSGRTFTSVHCPCGLDVVHTDRRKSLGRKMRADNAVPGDGSPCFGTLSLAPSSLPHRSLNVAAHSHSAVFNTAPLIDFPMICSNAEKGDRILSAAIL